MMSLGSLRSTNHVLPRPRSGPTADRQIRSPAPQRVDPARAGEHPGPRTTYGFAGNTNLRDKLGLQDKDSDCRYRIRLEARDQYGIYNRAQKEKHTSDYRSKDSGLKTMTKV